MALRQEELTSLCDDVDLDRDRALVERCQAGDSAAFGNLYARYYERLLRFCLRRLNDRHEAEDAAQEAFARAWKALPRFAGERRFYPWLTVIAGNICTDMLRRRSRSTPTDDMELTRATAGRCRRRGHLRGARAGRGRRRAGQPRTRPPFRRATVTCSPCARARGGPTSRSPTTRASRSGRSRRCCGGPARPSSASSPSCPSRRRRLAGFLIATGALIRRTVFRAAHRGATVQHRAAAARGACATPWPAWPSPAPPSPPRSSPRTRCRAARVSPAPAPRASALAAPPLASGGSTTVCGAHGGSARGRPCRPRRAASERRRRRAQRLGRRRIRGRRPWHPERSLGGAPCRAVVGAQRRRDGRLQRAQPAHQRAEQHRRRRDQRSAQCGGPAAGNSVGGGGGRQHRRAA